MKRPILSLSTAPRAKDYVEIDGQAYPLKHQDDLPLSEIIELNGIGGKFQQLPTQPSNDDLLAAAEALARTLSIVLEAPAEVIAKLTLGQQMAIAQTFTEARSRAQTPDVRARRRR